MTGEADDDPVRGCTRSHYECVHRVSELNVTHKAAVYGCIGHEGKHGHENQIPLYLS